MKKFFEGISLSSIVAGTLAAVTSFLLASKIGIGGSVIGAAASYVVSAVATKIYQNVLTASGEKLQSASSSGNGITKDAENGDADGGTPRTAGSRTDVRDEPDTATGVTADDASSTHRPREIVFSRANGRTYSVDELRKSRFRASKHTAMIVTLVSGLLAVAVMLATQGRGTDNLVSPTTTTPARNDTGTRTGTPDQNNALPQTGTGDDSKGTSKDSKTDAPSTDLDANGVSGSNGAGTSDSKTDGTANGSNGTGTSKNPTTEDPTSQGTGGSQTGSTGAGTGSTQKDPSGSTSTSTGTSGTSGSPATGPDAGAGSTGK